LNATSAIYQETVDHFTTTVSGGRAIVSVAGELDIFTAPALRAAFTDAILKNGPAARERFLTLLRAGGSDYPYELYKRAGVDMASPEPYRALVARMNRLMDEIDALDHGRAD